MTKASVPFDENILLNKNRLIFFDKSLEFRPLCFMKRMGNILFHTPHYFLKIEQTPKVTGTLKFRVWMKAGFIWLLKLRKIMKKYERTLVVLTWYILLLLLQMLNTDISMQICLLRWWYSLFQNSSCMQLAEDVALKSMKD